MAQSGYTPIQLYYSTTASTAPTAGNLVAGELAINTADGKLFYKDSAGVVQVIGTKGGVGSSSTTQVLYNSSGLVTGSSSFVFDGTNVGIGTSSPSSFGGYTTISIGGTNKGLLTLRNAGGADAGFLYCNGTNFQLEAQAGFPLNLQTASGQPIIFTNVSTERMRVDTNGNLLVGTTSAVGKLSVVGGSTDSIVGYFACSNANQVGAAFRLFPSTNTAMLSSEWATVGTSLAFGIGPTERMRIDTYGNVGIGTSSPGAPLHVSTGSTTNLMALFNGDGGGGGGNSDGVVVTYNGAGVANFRVKMYMDSYNGRIDMRDGSNNTTVRIAASGNSYLTGGNFLVGTTTAGANALLSCNSGSNYWQYGASTTGSSIFWVLTSGGTGVSLTAGNTSWAAQSDERNKDIIEPISDALNKVNSLRSVIGKYKIDKEGTRRSFLIAQDVQKVLPEVIDTDTDEQSTLSIRYTEVIPLLVASIKELNAKVIALESQLGTK